MIFDVKEIISLVVGCVGCIIAFVKYIKDVKTKNKELKVADLKTTLKEQIIPLMEEAERLLNNGTDRENWVLKKLSDATHIDFYTHKNILGYAKEIINEICTTTKIDVNKVIIKEEKEQPKTEQKEVGTNGVF